MHRAAIIPDGMDPQVYRRARAKLVELAMRTVQRAIRKGQLIPLQTCEFCGEGMADWRRIIAAHADYEPPYLNVRWLCGPCHVKWDKQEPKAPSGVLRFLKEAASGK